MQPTDFLESNFTYTAPEGVSAEECGDLKVLRGTDPDGRPTITSCWQVTEEDIERMRESGVLWITIYAKSMPMISVQTEDINFIGMVRRQYLGWLTDLKNAIASSDLETIKLIEAQMKEFRQGLGEYAKSMKEPESEAEATNLAQLLAHINQAMENLDQVREVAHRARVKIIAALAKREYLDKHKLHKRSAGK